MDVGCWMLGVRCRLLAVGCWLLTIGCMLASCTWVKDDVDACPYGFWLRLHYSYNILDVEAAPRYVKDAYVYVYDADGEFVKRIFVTGADLSANDYRVRVEGLPEGDYRFVVWSGIGSGYYAVSGDTQSLTDFRISLAADNRASELPALFYGSLPTVHYDDAYAEYDIGLMKNTNQLSCLVVPIAETTEEIAVEDYTMKVVADNAMMDAWNQIVSDTKTVYEPFEQSAVTFDDADYGTLRGLRYNIMTLRLMSDRDSRIVLEKKSTGETLFNISFPEYLGMVGALYTNLGRQIPLQEYLDRQDFYTIVFYLSGDLSQLLQLQVNNWRLRANHHLKL